MQVYEEMVWHLFCLGEISEDDLYNYLGPTLMEYL